MRSINGLSRTRLEHCRNREGGRKPEIAGTIHGQLTCPNSGPVFPFSLRKSPWWKFLTEQWNKLRSQKHRSLSCERKCRGRLEQKQPTCTKANHRRRQKTQLRTAAVFTRVTWTLTSQAFLCSQWYRPLAGSPQSFQSKAQVRTLPGYSRHAMLTNPAQINTVPCRDKQNQGNTSSQLSKAEPPAHL